MQADAEGVVRRERRFQIETQLMCNVWGWPEPYAYTMHACVLGGIPAKITVYTLCKNGTGQP